MGLQIETGSGANAAANAYGVTDEAATRAAARSYAQDRGITLPAAADPDPIDPLLIAGTDYINSFQDNFVGKPTSVDQPLPWPRTCIFKNDGVTPFPDDELPQSLLNCLYQLCIEQANGIELMPSSSSDSEVTGRIKREKTDVLETEYSELIGTTSGPSMPAVDALMKLFTRQQSGMFTVRV